MTGEATRTGLSREARDLRVVSVRQLTPRWRRIRLGGADLAAVAKFEGIHARFRIPCRAAPGHVERIYTIRSFDADAGYIEIDVFLHGNEGPGSCWGSRVQPGEKLVMTGLVGRRPVLPADWYLLAADETGTPALGRILENLPGHVQGVAFLQAGDLSDLVPMSHRSQVEVHWLLPGADAGFSFDALVDAVRSVDWPRDLRSFGWFAGEASSARSVRDYWRRDLSHGSDVAVAASYWRSERPRERRAAG